MYYPNNSGKIALQKKRSRKPLLRILIVACVCAVSAIFIFALPAYHYGQAENALRDGDYAKAEKEFLAAGNFMNAPERVENAIRSLEIVERGKCEFGEWRGEPIEWRVLDVEDDRALLVSKEVLALRQYEGADETRRRGDSWIYDKSIPTVAVTDVHEWLRDVFLEEAFSESEQRSILLTPISYFDEENYIYQDRWDTELKLFLLSVDEVKRYFNNYYKDRWAMIMVTKEDVDTMIKIDEDTGPLEVYWNREVNATRIKSYLNKKIPVLWLLRTPGSKATHVSGVNQDGIIFEDGTVGFSAQGIRPAMYVSLR